MKIIVLLILWFALITIKWPSTPDKSNEVFSIQELEELAENGMILIDNSTNEPTEIWRNNKKVEYLLCLNDSRTVLRVYEVTKTTFHNRRSVLVRCRDGVFYISNSYI